MEKFKIAGEDLLSSGLDQISDWSNQNIWSKIDIDTNTYFNAALAWRPPRDPLALDLDGDGIETVSQNTGIVFDHDGDQFKQGTSWLKGDDGWLVLDKNNNGMVDSGQELFGDSYTKSNGTKAVNAFDALADIDSNKDGVINANDAKFADLRVWQDLNQDGISQANELKTLDELNITELKTTISGPSYNMGNGVIYDWRINLYYRWFRACE